MSFKPARRSPLRRPKLHLPPVAALLEHMRGAANGRFVVVLADQHEADRQAVAHPTWQGRCRMAGYVEWCGIANHFEGALDITARYFPAIVRYRRGVPFCRRGRRIRRA